MATRKVPVKPYYRTEDGKKVLVKGHTRTEDVEEKKPEKAPLQKSRQREMALWLKWKTSGERPEDMRPLVESFQPLINRAANEYIGNVQLPPEAIRTEFTKHLIEGLKRYDPAKGASLSTFATWYMRKTGRYIKTYQNAARIPEERIDKIRTYEMKRQRLTDKLGRLPTDGELAHGLKWPVKQVTLLRTELRKDLTTSQFESDPTAVSPPKEMEIMKLFLYELKEDEQEVYRYLTGLGRPRTTDVKVISKKTGMTTHKIYRIRKNVASQLGEHLKRAGIASGN